MTMYKLLVFLLSYPTKDSLNRRCLSHSQQPLHQLGENTGKWGNNLSAIPWQHVTVPGGDDPVPGESPNSKKRREKAVGVSKSQVK